MFTALSTTLNRRISWSCCNPVLHSCATSLSLRNRGLNSEILPLVLISILSEAQIGGFLPPNSILALMTNVQLLSLRRIYLFSSWIHTKLKTQQSSIFRQSFVLMSKPPPSPLTEKETLVVISYRDLAAQFYFRPIF